MLESSMMLLALKAIMSKLSIEGGYGGIDLCIRCKEKGLDRYVNADGLESSACEVCPNNMTAVKWND